jgi:uncharacterized membrane protein
MRVRRFGWEKAVLIAVAMMGATLEAGGLTDGAAPDRPPFRVRAAYYLRSRGWPDELIVGAISTLPVIELRGAIPVAIHVLDMPWWKALPIAVVGNMAPIPLILVLLGPLSRLAMRVRVGRRFFEWLFARTRRQTAGIEKYETLGLTIFVAIPLPATGGWTGAMAAFLLGLRFRHAIWAIGLGVLVAGGIVAALSLLGWWGALIAGVALLMPVLGALARAFRREMSRA